MVPPLQINTATYQSKIKSNNMVILTVNSFGV